MKEEIKNCILISVCSLEQPYEDTELENNKIIIDFYVDETISNEMIHFVISKIDEMNLREFSIKVDRNKHKIYKQKVSTKETIEKDLFSLLVNKKNILRLIK